MSDSEVMVKLFREGNADGIANYFNPSIQLSTPGKEGVFSKAQAKMILSEFFSSNTPTSAVVKSKGNSENGAQFMTIDMVTASSNYKVNISYRGSGNKLRIHELKIEK